MSSSLLQSETENSSNGQKVEEKGGETSKEEEHRYQMLNKNMSHPAASENPFPIPQS